MDLEPIILNLFEEHLMATQQSIEFISPAISKSAEAIVQALVSDQKIIICGSGEGELIARHLCDSLLFGMERERPALPAHFISSHSLSPNKFPPVSDSENLSIQIRALGAPGDILIMISSDGIAENLNHAAISAQEKGIQIIAFTGRDGGPLADTLSDQDVEVRVPSASVSRVSEIHWFVAHCLTDLVDNMLFGAEN